MKIIFAICLLAVCITGWQNNDMKNVVTSNSEMDNICTFNSLVFIAGFDEDDNRYYGNAEAYFEQKGFMVIDTLSSLEGIIQWLNKEVPEDVILDEIHIVSHSNPWMGMSMTVKEGGERLTVQSLNASISEAPLPEVTHGIADETKIVFHACGLGSNTELLGAIKQVFSKAESPTVYASNMFSVFGGRYAPHYLAQPYFVFYPTAESPGPLALSEELHSRYPASGIDWYQAMQTRKETGLGRVYTHKFNIPLEWEFVFDNKKDMPLLKDRDAIMDWVSEHMELVEVFYALDVPMEKFRWRTERKGNTLIVKGKTTVICILEPVMSDCEPDEYRTVSIEDAELYRSL